VVPTEVRQVEALGPQDVSSPPWPQVLPAPDSVVPPYTLGGQGPGIEAAGP
jgi:hypothetical protein